MRRTQLQAFHSLARALTFPANGRTEIKVGSASSIPIEDASVDIVLAMESISHIIGVDRFFGEAARILRPGGALIVADSNNGSNPRVERENRAVWDVAENGPPGRSAGHYVCVTPYLELRRKILESEFPDLDGSRIDDLARNTFGMTKPEILQVVRAHLAGGLRPTSRFAPDRCPVNPVRAYHIENTFRPVELASRLERFGFRARAYPYFGGARGGLVAAANRALSIFPRLTMPFAGAFRLVAARR